MVDFFVYVFEGKIYVYLFYDIEIEEGLFVNDDGD